MEYDHYINVGIALGLGLLVGLQRELANSKLAGIRTFPIVTVMGSIAGLLSQHFDSSWIIAMGGLTVAILTVNSNVIRGMHEKEAKSGQTTEAALILMFFLGTYVVLGDRSLAVVIGALVAVLLHLKPFLSNTTQRLGDTDTKAIMQFVVIALVVLPILPDKFYGPYDVINPYEIWTLVVLIVGISVFGYFIHQWITSEKSTLITGILGGIISSTATTISYAKKASETKSLANTAFIVLILAKTVSYVRVLIEIAVVTPQNWLSIAPPFFLLIALLCMFLLVLFRQNKEQDTRSFPQPSNPAQLKTAAIFGGLYTIILLAVAYGEDQLGSQGLYVISAISGLANMDAITLSLSQSIESGRIDVHQGWNLIMIASVTNMFFKAGIVSLLGSKALMRKMWLATFGMAVAVFFILLLWPV